MNAVSSRRVAATRALWFALAAVLLARLATLGAYPLFDETESRYAEIARLMLARRDWITLWYMDRVPFWAKPPLSTWLSAASMALFGLNEFAARLPSLLCGTLTLVAVAAWAGSIAGMRGGLLAALMLAGSVGFFVNAGAVMTDPALVACVAIGQWAGWRVVASTDVRIAALAAVGAFVAAGVGLLDKGPVAAALALGPAALSALWAGLRGARPPAAVAGATIAGFALMLAIALPWYLAAEARTPGLLNYFLIGEHVGRFARPGWSGDLYGHPKQAARGAVWLYALLAALPWPLALLRRDARAAACGLVRRAGSDPGVRYAAICAFLPLALFTLSRNVIWTYALPALPALAVLAVAAMTHGDPEEAGTARIARRDRRLAATGCAAALAVAVALMGASRSGRLPTAKPLADAWRTMPESGAMPLVFAEHRPYSAEFYLRGRTIWVGTQGALVLLAEDAGPRCAAFPKDEWTGIGAAERARLRVRWSDARTVLACRDGPPLAASPYAAAIGLIDVAAAPTGTPSWP